MLGYAIAGAAAAGVVSAGYHTMAPRSQLYGPTFVGVRGSHQLALTYDDGPNDPHTLKLLEVLARHNVRATFFVLGKFVAARPDIVRDIVGAGHVIGNHTYSHRNLIFATRAQIAAEIRDCAAAINDALALPTALPEGELPAPNDCHPERRPHVPQARFWPQARAVRVEGPCVSPESGTTTAAALLRPPFGARRPLVLRVVREMGYVPVMWSVVGRDWRAPAAIEIERAITRRVRGGEVILLHDGGHIRLGANRAQTVVATDRLISRFKGEGYEFATIPEMMRNL